jgi:hypothetical protein
MNMTFKCAKCGQELEVPRDAAGQQAECPECGAGIEVPTPAALLNDVPEKAVPAVRLLRDGVAMVSGERGPVHAALRQAMLDCGGKVAKDEEDSGTLEARWRYGLNAFGLRVVAKLSVPEPGQVEVALEGGFRDAAVTTGACKEKALGVMDALVRILSGGADATPQSSTIRADRAEKNNATSPVATMSFLGAVCFLVFSVVWWLFMGVNIMFTLKMVIAGAILGAFVGLFER